jgi:hypothetical protein
MPFHHLSVGEILGMFFTGNFFSSLLILYLFKSRGFFLIQTGVVAFCKAVPAISAKKPCNKKKAKILKDFGS